MLLSVNRWHSSLSTNVLRRCVIFLQVSTQAPIREVMKTLVATNVKKTLERVGQMAPVRPAEGDMPQQVVHHFAAELVEQATNARNLARMEPTYHPWF